VSFKKTKSLNKATLCQIRKTIGFKDREDDSLNSLWKAAQEANAVPFEREPHEPWALIPIKELDCVKAALSRAIPSLSKHIDKLFVCPDHFR
jgi:hypothetical protein